jgi:hypothetical protein
MSVAGISSQKHTTNEDIGNKLEIFCINESVEECGSN